MQIIKICQRNRIEIELPFSNSRSSVAELATMSHGIINVRVNKAQISLKGSF